MQPSLGNVNAADGAEEESQINFMFTINKEEIPTPSFGNFLHSKAARIQLNRDFIGADCKVVELKVIAVTKDKLPSLVAYKKYDINQHLQPRPVNPHHDDVIVSTHGVHAKD